MPVAIGTTLFLSSIFIILFIYSDKFQKFVTEKYIFLIIIGLVFRIIATSVDAMYTNDIALFKLWSEQLYANGISNFYSSDFFSDYPPGYMYILYIIGAIQSFLQLEGDAYILLIKTPAIIFDILTGVFIYKIALKRMIPTYAWFISLAYMLNPAIIMDSAIWGQVDSIYTFFMILSIYYITEKKYMPGFIVYAISVLIKPQALIIAPIYLFTLFDILRENKFDFASFKKCSIYCLTSIGVFFLGILPFAKNFDFSPVLSQYIETINFYSMATFNAYNFYALLGANFRDTTEPFFFFTYQFWGTIALIVIVVLSFYQLNKSKTKSNYFFTAGLLNTMTFMFAVKMHDRYIYASIVFFLIAFIYKADKKLLVLVAGFTLTFFINCRDVLTFIANNNDASFLTHIEFISFLNLNITVFMLAIAFFCYKKGESDEPLVNLGMAPEKPKPLGKMVKLDYILAISLTLVYGVVAFSNLGNTVAPQSPWDAREIQEEISSDPREIPSATVDFGTTQHITEMQVYTGPRDNQEVLISTSIDGETWQYLPTFKMPEVFYWHSLPMDVHARYVNIKPASNNLVINEAAFRDGEELLAPVSISPGAEPLFDEQEIVPTVSNYMNGTYFDEIYHARTAYEFIYDINVYEQTHPQLGKDIMSWGVMLFGMTPFGWRFMGTLVGVLMVFVMYAFAKKMFNKTGIAFFVATIFAFDFMHYTQTRIATIDSYVTLFIICMYYFMYCYYKDSFYYTKLSKTFIPLGLCGLFMGLSIATKWEGVYAAIGIAVIFFYTIYKRYMEYLYAKEHTDDANSINIVNNFSKYTKYTILICFVFFVTVPLIIYCVSYIQLLQTPGKEGIKSIVENQQYMFSYHSELTEPHPFGAAWWSWPLDIRPILFYSEDVTTGMKTAISSFGNPLVWWGGLVALGFCLLRMFKDKDKRIGLFVFFAFCIEFTIFIVMCRNNPESVLYPYIGEEFLKFIKYLLAPVLVFGAGYLLLRLDNKVGENTDKSIALFLIIGYASQYLPWTLIGRVTFVYHYFPSVPFLTLMLGYMFFQLFEHRNKYIKYGFAAFVIILFIMFYPILTGTTVSVEYVTKYLYWLPRWQLM